MVTGILANVQPRAAAVYWRVAFWLSVAHLVFFGYVVACIFPQWDAFQGSGVRQWYGHFGIFWGTVYLLLASSGLAWILLLASEVGGAWLLLRLIRGRVRRRPLIVYLLFVLGVLVPSEGAAVAVIATESGRGLLAGILVAYSWGVAINDLLLDQGGARRWCATWSR